MNFEIDEVLEIESLGECEEYVYDVGMNNSPHTFFANDILVHNSVFLNYGQILRYEGIDISDANKEACVKRCLEIDAEVKAAIEENLQKICGDIMMTPQMYQFESEEVISKLLIPSKKKYIARIVYDKTTGQYPTDDFTIKGMEFKKSNLSDPIKKFLQEMTVKIMDGATEEEVMKILKVKFDELPNIPIDDIAYVQGVRNIEKYANGANIMINSPTDALAYFPSKCPYHVAGALALNTLIDYDPELRDMDKVTEGEKGKIVFVCPTNMFKVKAITLASGADWNPKLYEYFKLDVEYMFDRLILGPLKPTFDALKFRITMDSILGFKFVDKDNTYIQPCLF
jgi:DNA polymerase elongation subunit (family B)